MFLTFRISNGSDPTKNRNQGFRKKTCGVLLDAFLKGIKGISKPKNEPKYLSNAVLSISKLSRNIPSVQHPKRGMSNQFWKKFLYNKPLRSEKSLERIKFLVKEFWNKTSRHL